MDVYTCTRLHCGKKFGSRNKPKTPVCPECKDTDERTRQTEAQRARRERKRHAVQRLNARP